MKRIVALCMFMVGCGEGPKHIPKSDYQHGKAAFEMLEQYDKASDGSFPHAPQYGPFLLTAAEQMDEIDAKHLKNGLQNALTDYEEAIGERITASYALYSAALDVESAEAKGNRDVSIPSLTEKKTDASLAIYEIQPIVKLCRDDVAQYFDATAASTGSCAATLKAYKAKHP